MSIEHDAATLPLAPGRNAKLSGVKLYSLNELSRGLHPGYEAVDMSILSGHHV